MNRFLVICLFTLFTLSCFGKGFQKTRADSASIFVKPIFEKIGFYIEPFLTKGSSLQIPNTNEIDQVTPGFEDHYNAISHYSNGFGLGTSILLFSHKNYTFRSGLNFQFLHFCATANTRYHHEVFRDGKLYELIEEGSPYTFSFHDSFLNLPVSFQYYFLKKINSSFFIDPEISGSWHFSEKQSDYNILKPQTEDANQYTVFGSIGIGYNKANVLKNILSIEPTINYEIVKQGYVRYLSAGLRIGLYFRRIDLLIDDK